MRKGVIIAGYYGANNTGDEAILSGMLQSLKKQGITEITVLSRNPEQTKQLHNVHSLYIGRRFDGLAAIYQALRRSQLFILGGGGLLQDYSARVVPYWLSRVVIALLARTPVMYYAQGIGPLRTAKATRLIKLISNRVKSITVRDQASLQLLQEVGVNKPSVTITADPALAIEIVSDGKELLKQAGAKLVPNVPKIGIALRSWQGEEQYLPHLIKALNRLQQETASCLYFFPLQRGEDEQINNQVRSLLVKSDSYIIEGEYPPEQIAAMLKEMDGVIAMRLHAVILGAISATPAFGLVYDPKVQHFMERLQMAEYSYPLEDISRTQDELSKQILIWSNQLTELRKKLKEPVAEMFEQAKKNAEIANNLIKEGINNG